MIRRQPSNAERKSESGMSLIAILGMMTIFAIALLAVAPTVQLEVQREKELEAIRRGEEVAQAIRQYVASQRKLPNSIDDLLEGVPQQGMTKKRQILRASAAVDPLSEDGQWRLITHESQGFINFARRVQTYNNGALPSSPQPTQFWDQFAAQIFVNLNSGTNSDIEEADDTEIDTVTSNTPFVGVASQSRAKSVLSYYGIENHSQWVFTPMFRGTGAFNQNARPTATPRAPNTNRDQVVTP